MCARWYRQRIGHVVVLGLVTMVLASCAELAFFIVSEQIESNESIPPDEKERLRDEVSRQLALADQLDGETEYWRDNVLPADDPAMLEIESNRDRVARPARESSAVVPRGYTTEVRMTAEIPVPRTAHAEVDDLTARWLAGISEFEAVGFRIDGNSLGRHALIESDGEHANSPFELIVAGPYPGTVELSVITQVSLGASETERRQIEGTARRRLAELSRLYEQYVSDYTGSGTR